MFALQLPFYENKPLYVWAARVARGLSASAARAPYVVSFLSYGLLGLLLPWGAVRAGASPWTDPFAQPS